MAGSKNNLNNRGAKTHNPDRTLVIVMGPGGKIVSRSMQVLEGISLRLSAGAYKR